MKKRFISFIMVMAFLFFIGMSQISFLKTVHAENLSAGVVDQILLAEFINMGIDANLDGDISQDELRAMTGYLDLWGRDITNLTGLRYAENISGLNIGWNPINDYSDIFYLTQLENICINELGQHNPRIDNLNGFEVFTSLRELNAGFNNISSIEPIVGLTQLEWLNMPNYSENENALNDEGLTNINQLINLRGLDIEGNNVTDISFLSSILNIEWLSLRDNEIHDITVLSNLLNLNDVRMQNNYISLEPGLQLDTINVLINRGVHVEYEPQILLPQPDTEVADIPDDNLKQALFDNGVDYDGDGVIRIDELNYFTGTLMLWERSISDLTGLEHAINIEELHIGNNQNLDINDINIVSQMTYLRYLALNWIGLGSLDGLQLPNSLERIDVQGNNLTSITPLFQYNNINHIWAGRNEINNDGLNGINNLSNLGHISLDENYISSLSMFANMDTIWTLEVQYNEITDLTPLLTMDNLGHNVIVFGNYIDLTEPIQINVINDLLIRCNNVEYEPQRFVPDPDSPILFDIEENLKQALIDNGADYDGDGELTQDELRAMTGDLEIGERELTNIDGLQYAANIRGLWIDHNNISDISLIFNNLTQLEALNVSCNPIADYNGLNNLTQLDFLVLSGCPIGTMPDISNLVDLQHLYITNIGISDISWLSNLPTLRTLHIQDNQITDFSAIGSLTSLNELWLSNLSISSLDGFSLPMSLTTLSFDFNNLSNIDALSGLTNLEYLALTGNNLNSDAISILSNLTNVTRFDLNNNNITDISVLANCPLLYRVELDGNNITDITTLDNLNNLREVTLYNNHIDFEEEDQLNTLNTLLGRGVYVEYEPQIFIPETGTEVANILDDNLKQALFDNGVDYDVDGTLRIDELAYFTGGLNLDGRGIQDITGLEHLNGVTWLNLQWNDINDISPLANLTNITDLFIHSNNVTDITPLDTMIGLSQVHMAENYIDFEETGNAAVLQKLIDNNVYLEYEPQRTIIPEPQPGTEVANIPDENLKQALFDIGVDYDNDEVLRIDELAFITWDVDLSWRNITDLTGLEHMQNAWNINLGGNPLSNMNALSLLTDVGDLWLDDIGWSDISLMPLPQNLERIALGNNGISDISRLVSVNGLYQMYMRDNNISDISCLAQMSNIDGIFFDNNQISDISVITNFPELRFINFEHNNIIDITPLNGIDTLQEVVIHGNYIDFTKPNQNAVIDYLYTLDLWRFDYESQRFIPDPNSPTITFIDDNLRIALINSGADYYPDGNLTQDELRAMTGYLDLWGRDITNLTGLRYAENISGLNIGWNPINDYSDIFFLTQLESICVNELGQHNPRIDNLNGFEVFTNLKELNASFNNITSIEPIKNLTQLEWLNLINYSDNENALNDEGLININQLINLRGLDIEGNNVIDISFLSSMPNLEWLSLRDNEIHDITVLSNLLNLNDVRMQNNYISLEPGLQLDTINVLINRGVYVEYEPQISLPKPGTEVANIPDDNLKQALFDNGVDYDSDGILRIDELAYLTGELNLDGREIQDITGLEHLNGVTRLNLQWNEINDISPLANLTNITDLFIHSNNVTDITPLDTMIGLSQVHMAENYIDFEEIGNAMILQKLIDNNVYLEYEPQKPSPPDPESESAGIVDPILTAALIERGYDFYPDGELSQAELQYITNRVYLNNCGITNITGLQYLENIEGLIIRYNNISDFTPLTGLINLQQLDIANTGLDSLDLGLIGGMTNLVNLNIERNNLSDIDAIAGMINLEWLFMTNNSISDVSALSNMPNLYAVFADNNIISDVSALDSLVSFSELRLSNNRMTSLEDFTKFISLSSIEVDGNYINIVDSTESGYLDVLVNNGCEVIYDSQNVSPDPLSPIVSIPDANLKQALMSRNLDMNNDGNLSQAELSSYHGNIYLDSYNIVNIEGVQYLNNVGLMNLRENPITDLSPLAGMDNLTGLVLNNNSFSDISPLASLSNLKSLTINNNGISDISALEGLVNLEYLNLTNNPIEEIDALVGLVNLTYLSLWDTKVATLDPLYNLDKVERLYVVGGVWDISILPEMDSLTRVILHDGYLDTNEDSDDMEVIRYLENNGVYVRYENQTSIEEFIPDPESSPAGIVDDNLRQLLINRGLDYYPDGILTKDELRAWTRSVWLMQLPISDLSGLQYLINAIAINIGNSPDIEDFSPVLGLDNLTGLSISNCGLENSDLNQFIVMDNLENFFLDNNNLTIIDVLANMNSLQNVRFANNKVSDISALASMPNLTSISGDNNIISSMVAFRYNDRIYDISMRSNRIETAADIATMTNLGNVCIEGNLINLSDVDEIAYISAIENYTQSFEYPYFTYEPQAQVPDPASPIVSIPDLNLKAALLDHNRDFNNDGNLTQDELATFCSDVNLNENDIENLNGVQYLVNALRFNARNNDISDINLLTGLTQLESLYIPGNNVTDASIVSNLVNLKWLNLSENNLSMLPDLSNLSNLESLYFADNNISDIEFLRNLSTNVRIIMNNNKITDISVLLSINGLTQVDIQDNYLNLSEGSDTMNIINTLIANGVTVRYEQQNPYIEPIDPEVPGEIEVVEEVVETTTEDGTVNAEIDDVIVNSIVEDAIAYQQESGETDVNIILPLITIEEGIDDVGITLDAEAMQAASDSDIGLVVATDEVAVNLPPSALDAGAVGTIDENSTILIEINDADDTVITEPIFQIEDGGGNVLAGAIELNIIVTTSTETVEITEFNEPVVVTMQLTAEDIAGVTDPNNLVIYWYNPINGVTEAMDTTYNIETMELTFITTHFSTFILVENDLIAPIITIHNPLEFEVLPMGVEIVFNVIDNFTEECTTTAILYDGTNEYEVFNRFVPSAGVYTLTVTAIDKAGNISISSVEFVIYNPEGGFVTGGGWINSPKGAYTNNPELSGKATFGFVSKYLKGAKIPTGQTTFKFKTADFAFNSTSYDWLVVAGTKAQYKGVGTINGEGLYRFMLTAIDGDSKDKDDRFRIKIWDIITDEIIYDNQVGTEDSGELTTDGTLLGGGSIIIHK